MPNELINLNVSPDLNVTNARLLALKYNFTLIETGIIYVVYGMYSNPLQD